MPISIDGTGTITGLSAGGLPDLSITTADIADSAITTAKIANAAVAAADLSGAQTGSAPIYGVRAWCTFNGATTGTNAPTSGGNVSTVARTATGSYTITFSTGMATSNYCVTAMTDNGSSATVINAVEIASRGTGSCSIVAAFAGGGTNRTLTDKALISVAFLE
jgi:hypothetical protein